MVQALAIVISTANTWDAVKQGLQHANALMREIAKENWERRNGVRH